MDVMFASKAVVMSDRFQGLSSRAKALYYRLLFEVDQNDYVGTKSWVAIWEEEGYTICDFFELFSSGFIQPDSCDRLFVPDYSDHFAAFATAVDRLNASNDDPNCEGCESSGSEFCASYCDRGPNSFWH